MLYSDITYEMILARMIDRVNKWAAQRGIILDTREGSLIRTALSPAAAELKLMYIELNEVLNESFADTASRDFLIRRAAERGIAPEPPFPGTKAIRQGEFSMNIPIGSRFSLSLLNYIALEQISNGVFKMECETPGIVGNLDSGPLVPINYINGLEWARLTDVLIPGEDEEPTEHLRQRYFDSLKSQAFGGNIADYKEKVNKLLGVYGCKVYPVWNGGGTVKIVFINSQFQKPSPMLVDEVQTALDPVQNQGMGLGIAPIGHVVTVTPVDETTINITTTLTYQGEWDWAAVKPYVEAAVDQYLLELSEGWSKVDWENDPTATLVVRISQIETRLLNLTGILDVQNTALNGAAQNMILDPNNIPIRGTVTDV